MKEIMKIKNINSSRGQVMLASVIILGGILASATAIAGILMVYQIREASDSENSAQALFAADSGIEAATLCFTKPDKCGGGFTIENPPLQEDFREFVSKAVTFEIKKTEEVVGNDTETTITSRGLAKNTIRILEAVLVTSKAENNGENNNSPVENGYPKMSGTFPFACVDHHAAIKYKVSPVNPDLAWVEIGGTGRSDSRDRDGSAYEWQRECSLDPTTIAGPRETKKWRWSNTDSGIKVCVTHQRRGTIFPEECTTITEDTPNNSKFVYVDNVPDGIHPRSGSGYFSVRYTLESVRDYLTEHDYE